MNPEHYQDLKRLFLEASDRRGAEREALLQEVRGRDPELAGALRRLLAADERDEDSLTGVVSETQQREAPLPQRIGPYEITGLLGVGGMGVVYRARQRHPQREVALKVLHPGLLSPRMARRFALEAEVLGRLQDPGIAQVYDAGTWTAGDPRSAEGVEQPYFAMELVNGLPLTEYVRRHGLKLGDRLRLFVRVCRAVHHAHQKGVVHRDLKPGNIMVTPEGQPKIVDFGIARSTDADVQATTLGTDLGQLVGTIPYMSPEQVAGDPARIDTRCDVYALGVVLFELLAGRLPYDLDRRSLPDMVRVIRDEEPTALRSVNRSFRGDLETITATALAKDRERRYASAAELAAEVERHLNGQPIAARMPSTAYQLRKLVTRHKLPFSLAAMLAVVVAAAAVVAGGLAVRFAEQRDLAVAAGKRESEARVAAEQVADFLVNLFERADPGTGLESEPSLRDLLASGADRVETELRDQPAVRARLMQVLGSVYQKLGDHDQARDLLRSALDLRRRALGGDHPDLADSLLALAELHTTLGEHDAAASAAREALEIRRRAFGPGSPEVARALNALGTARHAAHDYEAAAERFRAALRTWRSIHADDHVEIAATLGNLGMTLGEMRRFEEALPLLREALEMQRRLPGDGTEVVFQLHQLAFLTWRSGDLQETERLLEERLELARSIFDEDHPRIADAIHDYAVVTAGRHGSDRAIPLYREALAIRRAAYGDDHPQVGGDLNDLGVALLNMERFEEAQAALEEMVAIRRRHFGNEHEHLAFGLNNLAQAYHRAGQTERALPAYEEAMEIFRRTRGERSAQVGLIHQNLGHLFTQMKDPRRAEAHHRKAIEIYVALDHPNEAGARVNLALLRFGEADFESAERSYRIALDRVDALSTPRRRTVAAANSGLAITLHERGRTDEAVPLIRRALEQAREIYGPDHSALVAPLRNAAVILLADGDRAAAEALAREAVGVARRKLDPSDGRLANALCALGTALLAGGRMDEAEPLLREAVGLYRENLDDEHWLAARARLALDRCLREQKSPEAAGPLHADLEGVTADD